MLLRVSFLNEFKGNRKLFDFFLVRFEFSYYFCSIAQLVQRWAVGGLIYEKDVFERLSL